MLLQYNADIQFTPAGQSAFPEIHALSASLIVTYLFTPQYRNIRHRVFTGDINRSYANQAITVRGNMEQLPIELLAGGCSGRRRGTICDADSEAHRSSGTAVKQLSMKEVSAHRLQAEGSRGELCTGRHRPVGSA